MQEWTQLTHKMELQKVAESLAKLEGKNMFQPWEEVAEARLLKSLSAGSQENTISGKSLVNR